MVLNNQQILITYTNPTENLTFECITGLSTLITSFEAIDILEDPTLVIWIDQKAYRITAKSEKIHDELMNKGFITLSDLEKLDLQHVNISPKRLERAMKEAAKITLRKPRGILHLFKREEPDNQTIKDVENMSMSDLIALLSESGM